MVFLMATSIIIKYHAFVLQLMAWFQLLISFIAHCTDFYLIHQTCGYHFVIWCFGLLVFSPARNGEAKELVSMVISSQVGDRNTPLLLSHSNPVNLQFYHNAVSLPP